MDELVSDVLTNILYEDRFYSEQREIELVTAQLEVLDFLVLEHKELIEKALEAKLEHFRDELINRRELIMLDQLKKRMVNTQSAWTALKER